MSVIFDQLRVSDDGNRLFIDMHVNEASYFDNLTISSITITTAEYVPNSVTLPNETTDNFIYKRNFPRGIGPDTDSLTPKRVSLMLEKADLDEAYDNWIRWTRRGGIKPFVYANTNFKGNFSGPLLFVFVEVMGTADECTPCGLDEYTLGVTFDTKLLYQRVMDYTKQMGADCTVPTGFTDYILLWNAFKASVETDHYIPAIKYYNMLFGIPDSDEARDGSHSPFGGAGGSKITKPCNCHG